MTETSGASAAVRTPRWLYVGLIGSLALNVLLVGGFATAAWHARHGGPGAKFGADMGLMAFTKSLPSERRKELRESFKAEKQKFRPLRDNIRDSWKAANDALAAEPFDKAKFKQTVDAAIAAEMTMRTTVSETLVNAAEKLTPEERKSFRDWREKHWARFWKRHEKKEDSGE